MATHRISVLNHTLAPDSTGSVWVEPYDVLATNDVWRPLVVIFSDTSTRIGIHGAFSVPTNYVGSAKIIAVWTSTATSGNVVWDFDYRAVTGDDAESLDQTGTQQAVTATDAAPSAAHRRMETSISVTSANIEAKDTVEFFFARDGADASDTIAASVILFDLIFEYSDT